METVKDYNKFKSRTWWLTIAWLSFIPLSIVAAIILAPYEVDVPINTIATGAVAATSLFLGGEKVAKIFREKKENASG